MKKHARLITLTLSICSLALTACVRDVDNNYNIPRHAAEGAAAGALSGLIYSSATSSVGIGAGVLAGAAIGGGAGYLGQSKTGTLLRLMDSGVQVIPYGEQITFVFNSDTLFEPSSSDIRYETYGVLMDTAAALKAFSRGEVTISAYADAVGNSQRGYDLTQKQAQSVLSFLWSHGIPYRRMHAVGYGRHHTVASNSTSFGSSFNRRVEILIRPPIA